MTKRSEYNQLVYPVNYSVSSMVNRWRKNTQEWLCPPVCTVCGGEGEEGRDLCSGCAGDLPRVTAARVQCGTPMSVRETCGQRQRCPPAIDRILAILRYQAPLDALIKKLKFNGDLHIARLLGTMMAGGLTVGEVMPDLIVPVPLQV